MDFITTIFFTFLFALLLGSLFQGIFHFISKGGISHKVFKSEKVSLVADVFILNLFIQSILFLAFKTIEIL